MAKVKIFSYQKSVGNLPPLRISITHFLHNRHNKFARHVRLIFFRKSQCMFGKILTHFKVCVPNSISCKTFLLACHLIRAFTPP